MEQSVKKFSLDEYKKHKLYSKYLEEVIDPIAAVAFIVGSEIIYDGISESIRELAKMPKGTHIGEISGGSLLADMMPEQFLMDYDYDFMYYLRSRLIRLQNVAQYGGKIIAHSVAEELLLYLIMEEAEFFLTEIEDISEEFEDEKYILSEWAYDIFDDSDILLLYNEDYIDSSHCYHFSHWKEDQFYMDRSVSEL